MHLRRSTSLAAAATAGVVSAQTVVTLADMLAAQNATLSILNGFLEQQQSLFNALSSTPGITVLAPSNNALSSLSTNVVNRVSTDPSYLAALLSYHVFNGTYYASQLTSAQSPTFIRTLLNSSSYSNVTGGQRIVSRAQNGDVKLYSGADAASTVLTRDYNFTGGTVHIIDSMLTLPANLTDTLLTANMTAAVGAIKQSGLGHALDSASELTIFAPTNQAFAAIGSVVAGMTSDELQTVLEYHVIQGKVLYSDLMGNGTAGTTEGSDVTFRSEDGGMFVNGAKIIAADVLIANGVVHFIDGVLNPDNTSATPNPTASTQAPAFSGASATGGVPFTTGITPPAKTSAVVTTTITAGPNLTGAASISRAGMGLVALLGVVVVVLNF